MKLLHISIISLLFTLIFNTTSFSKHLKGKSKKVHDEYLEIRIVGLPSQFDNIKIQPANDIKSLTKKLIENKNTKKIDKIIKKKSLLSVLYFDGENVVVDKKSEKIKNDTKLYSFSISKSFLSYILGNAICDGHIKSLDDKISKYVPEAKGTLYENSTFKELIDMAAGDKNFASREPGSAKLFYAVDVMGRKTTAKDYLLSSSGIKISKKTFNYNNFIADLVARAIDVSVPGGLKNLYQDFANKSGTNSEMFYLTDDNGWPLLHGYFYANREDFLRLGIQISKDWNSNSCIGNYLNGIEKMKIKTDKDQNSDYSGYFWYDQNNKSRHAQLRGHGGQRIHIDIEKGSVLIYHSITGDYDNKSIWRLIK
tara:strand:- start:17 stop:1117 length:1101 start_codon:yes stop_codon:yes gene_type:complete